MPETNDEQIIKAAKAAALTYWNFPTELSSAAYHSAFESLFKRYNSHVLRCIPKWEFTQQDEGEIHSDAFLAIYHSLHRFEPQAEICSDFEAWSRKIVERTAVDYLRRQNALKRGRQFPHDSLQANTDPDNPDSMMFEEVIEDAFLLDEDQIADLLEQTLEALCPKPPQNQENGEVTERYQRALRNHQTDRAIFELYYLDQLKDLEIAERLGIDRTTVTHRRNQFRVRLKEKILEIWEVIIHKHQRGHLP